MSDILTWSPQREKEPKILDKSRDQLDNISKKQVDMLSRSNCHRIPLNLERAEPIAE